MQLIIKQSVELSVFLSQSNKRPYIHIEMPIALSRHLLIKKMIRAEYNSPTHSIKIYPCEPENEELMGYGIKTYKSGGKYFTSFDLPGRPYGVFEERKTYMPIARQEKDYLWVKL